MKHKFLCLMFLSVFFGHNPPQNTPFFEKLTNQIHLLNYVQLVANPCEAKTILIKIVQGHGQFNIDRLRHSLLKVLASITSPSINYGNKKKKLRCS